MARKGKKTEGQKEPKAKSSTKKKKEKEEEKKSDEEKKEKDKLTFGLHHVWNARY